MTREIKTKQLIHTFLFLLSLLLRGFKVPDKAGGSQVSQGEDYLPLENTSSWKIQRKKDALGTICEPELSVTARKHLHGTGTAGWHSGSPLVDVTWISQVRKFWEWLPGGLEGLKELPQTLPSTGGEAGAEEGTWRKGHSHSHCRTPYKR